MKIKQLKVEEKEFKPIRLDIVIENIKELAELWKRLNIDPNTIDRYNGKYNNFSSDCSGIAGLWKILDKKIKNFIS